MRHARPDYDRIQDPAGIIPEDEPVFLIRGQDMAGPRTVDAWADQAMYKGASPDIINAAREQANEMRLWQSTQASKVPDLPDPNAPQATHGLLGQIKMTDEDLRLECLKLAIQLPNCSSTRDAIILAGDLYSYTKGGSR